MGGLFWTSPKFKKGELDKNAKEENESVKNVNIFQEDYTKHCSRGEWIDK